MGSWPLSFKFQFKCPLLQQAFLGIWSKVRLSSLVTLCFYFFIALIATSNYLGFPVRFPRSRAKGQILEQLTDLLRECSLEKLVREQRRQDRAEKMLSKDVVQMARHLSPLGTLEHELHHRVCPALRQGSYSESPHSSQWLRATPGRGHKLWDHLNCLVAAFAQGWRCKPLGRQQLADGCTNSEPDNSICNVWLMYYFDWSMSVYPARL